MDALSNAEPRGVDFNVVRQCSRQTFDVHLARMVVHNAAFLDAGRGAPNDMDRHLDANRLIHGDFKEIGVEYVSLDRIHLEITQQRGTLRLGFGPVDRQRDQSGASGLGLQDLVQRFRFDR